MSTPTIRAALERLIQSEVDLVVPYDECGPAWHELIAAAHAALAAAPEGEPSGEELIRTYAHAVAAAVDAHPGAFDQKDVQAAQLAGLRAVLARWGRPAAQHADGGVPRIGHILRLAEIIREVDGKHDKGAAALAEAILSHPEVRSAGIPATPPAQLKGEVGELISVIESCAGFTDESTLVGEVWAKIVALLSQLSAAAPAVVPVAVSERPILKSNPFNDADGRCWCGTAAFADSIGDLTVEHPPSWELRMPQPEDDCVVAAHAIPLPAPQGGQRDGMSWQPIATAPQDALILLYRPGIRYPWAQVDIGRWDDNHHAKHPRPFWRSMNGLLGITEMRNYSPSHWQPLPAPPAPQGGEGEG